MKQIFWVFDSAQAMQEANETWPGMCYSVVELPDLGCGKRGYVIAK